MASVLLYGLGLAMIAYGVLKILRGVKMVAAEQQQAREASMPRTASQQALVDEGSADPPTRPGDDGCLRTQIQRQ